MNRHTGTTTKAGPNVGTRHLVRLALRRDRIILPLWILLLGIMPASTAGTFEQLYPTMAERAGLTSAMQANPSIAVLYGPAFDLSTAGGFVAWRLLGFMAVFIALMAIFTVTRHTRAEEDTGRGELLGSTVVGRYAMLTAAVIVAGGTSVLIGLIQIVTLAGSGLPMAGSLAFGLATATTGLVFTAVSAVAVQIAEYSRTANSISSAVLGAAFLIRGVGDANAGGDLGWISWLSPLGWPLQLRAFADERWWALGLSLVTAVVVGAVGYKLLPRRDFDAGILRGKPGPATAAPTLNNPLALAWRLHRGSLIGWSVGFAVSGLMMGAIANGIGDIIGDSEQGRQMFERMGGSSGMINAFLAAMTGMFGMIAAIYGVQATLRMRAEEVAVRVEPLLATRVSRLSWTASHLTFAFLGTALITVIAGFTTGLAHGLQVGDVSGALGDVLAGTLVQLPAVWLIVGVAAAIFGLLPKYTAAAWGIVLAVLLLGWLGPALQLPQVLLDLSPFTHVPKIPGSEFTAAPLAWLIAIAAVALAAGLTAFRRRDIG
ncbi:ABC-2 type transport system permease protein [Amycolatopsis marina]|uniref:ABC-2 type transport system permease protein n=1 Tax=Amycolatopsis marina TaxID=490629 RepID=A0A1I0VB09_9PSEU|nr:ABC transporter permease [Amycolatopsis marina]SFA72776.1 ABC-2 type transport system permease protein [Amycolatopsis marina]